jgi:hypothetical protein
MAQRNHRGVTVVRVPYFRLKRLNLTVPIEMLSEFVPRAKAIALLVNPNNAIVESVIRSAQEAARTKGVQLQHRKGDRRCFCSPSGNACRGARPLQ